MTIISEQAKVDLVMRMLAGEAPIAAAAALGLPPESAATVHRELMSRLETLGASDRAAGKAKMRVVVPPPKRKSVKPLEDQALVAATARASAQPARRSLTFEEQLARVAAGAGICVKLRMSKPAPAITLGGVGSSLL